MSNNIYPSLIKGLAADVLKTPEFATIVQTAPNFYTTRIPQSTNPIWHISLIYNYIYGAYNSPQNTQPYGYSDIQTLMGFFLSNRGQSDDFLFFDPSDFTANGMASGSWRPGWPYPAGSILIDYRGHAQQLIAAGISGTQLPGWNSTGGTTADGGITWSDLGYFPNGWPNQTVSLQVVTDGKGGYYSPIQRNVGGMFREDVTDLIPGTLQVFSNGALQNGANYTVMGPGLAVPGASFMGLYLKWAAQPAVPVTASFQFYFRVRFEADTQDFERWMQHLWTIGGSNSTNGSGYLKMVSSRPMPA